MLKIRIITVVALAILAASGYFAFGSNNSKSSNISTYIPASPKSSDVRTKTYALSDVSSHISESDCWTIIGSKVYNISSYVNQHPGGYEEILKSCGKVGTDLFNSQRKHMSSNTQRVLDALIIGDIKS